MCESSNSISQQFQLALSTCHKWPQQDLVETRLSHVLPSRKPTQEDPRISPVELTPVTSNQGSKILEEKILTIYLRMG